MEFGYVVDTRPKPADPATPADKLALERAAQGLIRKIGGDPVTVSVPVHPLPGTTGDILAGWIMTYHPGRKKLVSIVISTYLNPQNMVALEPGDLGRFLLQSAVHTGSYHRRHIALGSPDVLKAFLNLRRAALPPAPRFGQAWWVDTNTGALEAASPG